MCGGCICGSGFSDYCHFNLTRILHFILDFFNGGFAAFWPLSKKEYAAPFSRCIRGMPVWYYLFYEGYPLFTLISVVLFAAFLIIFL